MNDTLPVRSHQFCRARFYGFRAFCGITHDKHRFTQGGGFLLDATGVRQHEGATMHQINERQIFLRWDKKNMRRIRQQTAHRLLNMRIQVNRIDKLDVITFSEFRQGLANMFKTIAKIFPTMACDQNESFCWIKKGEVPCELSLQSCIGRDTIFNFQKRINDRIPCDVDPCPTNAFVQKVVTSLFRRRKVKICQSPGQVPIHLLRPWSIFVSGAQSRFHMANGNLCIIGGLCCGQGRCSIAMDKHDIRSPLGKHVRHTAKNVGGKFA